MLYSLWPKKKRRELLAVVAQEEIHGRGRAGLTLTFMRRVPAAVGAGGDAPCPCPTDGGAA